MARLTDYEIWKQEGILEDKLILVRAWARDGLTDKQIAESLGISQDSIIRYKKKYSEFRDALKKNKEIADIEVENSLNNNAKGYEYYEEVVSTKREVIYEDGKRVKEISEPVVIQIKRYKQPETLAQIFWLKNRQKEKWREKQEVAVSSNPIEDLTPLAELLKGNNDKSNTNN